MFIIFCLIHNVGILFPRSAIIWLCADKLKDVLIYFIWLFYLQSKSCLLNFYRLYQKEERHILLIIVLKLKVHVKNWKDFRAVRKFHYLSDSSKLEKVKLVSTGSFSPYFLYTKICHLLFFYIPWDKEIFYFKMNLLSFLLLYLITICLHS